MARRLAALSLAGLAALAYLTQATSVPTVSPAQATLWEGQTVAIQGVLRDRRLVDGVCRFDLVADGQALAGRTEAPCPLEGTPVRATGRLARFAGSLTLLADDLAVQPLEATLTVSLSALATAPDLWRDQILTVHGQVDQGRLVQDGYRIHLGAGTWPKSGVLETKVLLRYDATCACERLDRVAA